jgi:hypothetical protein
MSNLANRRAACDDVFAASEHMIAEIIDGEIMAQPGSPSPHARAS